MTWCYSYSIYFQSPCRQVSPPDRVVSHKFKSSCDYEPYEAMTAASIFP